jgi:hypothetical protein
MSQYRKKPVVINAQQFIPKPDEIVFKFCICNNEERIVVAFPIFTDGKSQVLRIETLEGIMQANPGDYIIRGIKGEFYPCKAEIFEATYEKI